MQALFAEKKYKLVRTEDACAQYYKGKWGIAGKGEWSNHICFAPEHHGDDCGHSVSENEIVVRKDVNDYV